MASSYDKDLESSTSKGSTKSERVTSNHDEVLGSSISKESTKSDSNELKSIIDHAEPLDCFSNTDLTQALVRHCHSGSKLMSNRAVVV